MRTSPSANQGADEGALAFDIPTVPVRKEHRLSVDWLVGGDLKGRLKMAQHCPSLPRQDVVKAQTTRRAQEQEFRRLLLQFKPEQLPALVEILRQQFDNGGGSAA